MGKVGEESAWGRGAPRAHAHLTIFYKSLQVAVIYISVNVSSETHKFWGLDETLRNQLERNKKKLERVVVSG